MGLLESKFMKKMVLGLVIGVVGINGLSSDVKAASYDNRLDYGAEDRATADARKISNSKLNLKYYGNNPAVGVVRNGSTGQWGSGVVVGNHTFITARHAVNRGKAGNISIKVKGRTFKATNVYLNNKMDFAVVRTKARLSSVVRPMPMMSESNIKKMKKNTKINVQGYVNGRQYNSTGFYLGRYPNQSYNKPWSSTMMGKYYATGGLSGGAVTRNGYVVGIHTGQRPEGLSYNRVSGVLLIDDVKKQVNKYRK